MNRQTTEPEPVYAFLIRKISDPNYLSACAKISDQCCQTCGEPFLRAGDMCPECKRFDEQVKAEQMKAFEEWMRLIDHGVHDRGHGLLDPYSENDRDLIGDY